tara:strand:+ start:673 stop:1215 length:543 start_codon:yes stop_codon:yes gene_type:complete
MKISKTAIEGLLILEPNVWEDSRGYFFESWTKSIFENQGIDLDFVQDNQSFSHKDVLRGLHFQKPPFDQGKLVRVIQGSVLDIAVDIRKESNTYGKHYSIELNSFNKTIFWIPPGFAHGFISLEDNTIFSYKCTAVYDKSSESSLLWNDKDLAIDWKCENPIVSEKDKQAASLSSLNSPF